MRFTLFFSNTPLPPHPSIYMFYASVTDVLGQSEHGDVS